MRKMMKRKLGAAETRSSVNSDIKMAIARKVKSKMKIRNRMLKKKLER